MPSDHLEKPRCKSESSVGGRDPDAEGQRPDVDSPSAGMNGRRLGLHELNLGDNQSHGRHGGLWQRFLRGLSQFLAGMYTGESCAGTPHGEHKSDAAARDAGVLNSEGTKE